LFFKPNPTMPRLGLGLPFDRDSPGVDEQARPGEAPRDLALRLARAKAQAVAARHPGAWCLGSDQIAVLGDTVLGKPHTAARCVSQLLSASGREVLFLTAASLANTVDPFLHEHLDETRVRFRHLAEAEVRRYVELEQPLDCAGGFKCEGLGIALFERIDSSDPTALIGLPMIWVARALRQVGMDPLASDR
jgi:septum formation protein